MANKKLDNIAFIKTIMMVAIVLYHSMLFFGGQWFTVVEPVYDADCFYQIARWLNTFHIQTFTMVSGFLFYYLRSRRAEVSHWAAIKKRARRLLLPYLFVSILWAIPVAVYFFKYSALEIFYKYGLATNPSQLWYLIMLFGVFVFFELIGYKIKMSFKNLVIMFFATTAMSLLISAFNFNVFQLAKIAQYILYFYLGGYIYTYKNRITKRQAWLMAGSGVLLYLIIVLLRASNTDWVGYIISAMSPLVSIFEVGAIYYLCTYLVDKCKVSLHNRLYRLYAENSFGIYLFHQQIIYFTIILLNGVVHPIVQVILSFMIASVVSILMSVLLRKNKVTRSMFGL